MGWLIFIKTYIYEDTYLVNMADTTIFCFTCCINTQKPGNRKRRRKLDPSMIGAPVNFQHLNHIGSGESGGDGLQDHMKSKGGYEFKSEVNVERKLIDVKKL